MAKRRRYMRKKRSLLSTVLSLIIVLVAGAVVMLTNKEDKKPVPENTEDLIVHYIDVGQGDSILVQAPTGENLLIDAGPGSSEDELIAYLDALSIETIDYFVLTHPDEDHIGGADLVFYEYTVSTVILPDCKKDTKAYENLENAIASEPTAGEKFALCEGADVTVLAPISESYSDVNDYSVVLRLDYYKTSFLFTGDAHETSEYEMIERFTKGQLDCDVLKVGHHGSSSSSSLAFLKNVTPEFAIISCGEGNKYGHPHKEILDRMQDEDIPLYRTDLLGAIVVICDGKTAKISDNQG